MLLVDNIWLSYLGMPSRRPIESEAAKQRAPHIPTSLLVEPKPTNFIQLHNNPRRLLSLSTPDATQLWHAKFSTSAHYITHPPDITSNLFRNSCPQQPPNRARLGNPTSEALDSIQIQRSNNTSNLVPTMGNQDPKEVVAKRKATPLRDASNGAEAVPENTSDAAVSFPTS